jgi:hypothetical protein
LSPFVLAGDLHDAFTGENGGAGAFVDKYLPVRPAYRLYRAEYMLRQQGCDALADLYAETAEELTQQIALVGIGGLTGWRRTAVDPSSGIAAEAGASAITRLLYGARKGEGLPGSAGVTIDRRPTVTELENLTIKHGVEFAVTYKLGPGPKGAGGQYFLYSGEVAAVRVPVSADKALLELFESAGSPMRSSMVIPVGRNGLVTTFTKDGISEWSQLK